MPGDEAYRAGVCAIVASDGDTSACHAEAEPAKCEDAVRCAAAPAQSSDLEGLLDLPIEQLAKTPVVVPSMDIPVTSVTKEASTVGRSAAAVFVITNEMIRRSGATCIPEALRMAPGLEVAQVNSNTWAITVARLQQRLRQQAAGADRRPNGLQPGVFRRLLGRARRLLEDVDRIEVIRGPGGTLWGANAVNGVINVITKKAEGHPRRLRQRRRRNRGTLERDRSLRRQDRRRRLLPRLRQSTSTAAPSSIPTSPANDAWTQGRSGFRADWDLDKSKTDSLTIQGDHYVGDSGMSAGWTQTVPPFQQTHLWNRVQHGRQRPGPLAARLRRGFRLDRCKPTTTTSSATRSSIRNASRPGTSISSTGSR